MNYIGLAGLTSRWLIPLVAILYMASTTLQEHYKKLLNAPGIETKKVRSIYIYIRVHKLNPKGEVALAIHARQKSV